MGIAAAASFAAAADKYSGPLPPKHDVPYLLHADTLVETEAVAATQSASKNDAIFSVPGETSPARTPLAEPIFLFASDRISPASLGLYQFEVKNGRREIVIPKKKGGNVQNVSYIDQAAFARAISHRSIGLFGERRILAFSRRGKYGILLYSFLSNDRWQEDFLMRGFHLQNNRNLC